MIITRSELCEALHSCNRVIDRSLTLPALHHLRIRRDIEGVHFEATDLVMLITHSFRTEKPVGELAEKLALSALERERCDFLAPISTLQRCAKAADAESIVEITDEAIHFKMDGMQCCVPLTSLPLKEWPTFEPLGDLTTPPWRITPGAVQAIDACLPFVSTDETRYVLNGIYWSNDGSIVATNGRRLHISEKHAPVNAGHRDGIERAGIIIPTRAAPLLEGGMMASTDGVFLLSQSLSVRLYVRLIDGNFPNYKQVIPKDYVNRARIRLANPAAVAKSLTKLTPADPRLQNVRLVCSNASMRFVMGDKAHFTALVQVRNAPPPPTFTANPLFLAEAIQRGQDVIYMPLDVREPIVIVGPNLRDTHVLMPMRLEPPPATPTPQPTPANAEHQKAQG